MPLEGQSHGGGMPWHGGTSQQRQRPPGAAPGLPPPSLALPWAFPGLSPGSAASARQQGWESRDFLWRPVICPRAGKASPLPPPRPPNSSLRLPSASCAQTQFTAKKKSSPPYTPLHTHTHTHRAPPRLTSFQHFFELDNPRICQRGGKEGERARESGQEAGFSFLSLSDDGRRRGRGGASEEPRTGSSPVPFHQPAGAPTLLRKLGEGRPEWDACSWRRQQPG